MTAGPVEHAVRFGAFSFDVGTGRLWSGSREIHVTPRSADVLAQLVAHAGEPVSKATLFAAVWRGIAVSDDALTSCISELRRALGDDARNPRFIETRHRRGYRFVASLSRHLPAPALAGVDSRGHPHPRLEQRIRFCTTSDGASIAYATVGRGPLVVRVLGHFTHLEAEWEWPELRRFWEQLAEQYTVVRYDGRGIGLSEPFSGEFTEETRQRDLDAVLAALGAEPVALLGISEGGWTAASYAREHPARVARLVLYGAYSRGARARPGYDAEEDRALVTLIRKGWGRDTAGIRQLLTATFFRDDADPALIAHFNELQRISADADTAARYHESLHARSDGRALFAGLSLPVLVLHAREDLAVPAEEGRLLASLIPNSQLVLLPTGMHYFPTDPALVVRAADAIARFLSEAALAGVASSASPRAS
jgi:pimeloyl-ACP methyl ester carboxylesterase/DNA-binding winged helix-turn-helix (wHTH) protein